MKKLISFVLILTVLLCCIPATFAAEGNVTYTGNVGEFLFAPGGENSLTDLFPEFKEVMPGDTLTQAVTVKNDRSNDVKVKLYIRSLGAKEGSEEFLSQLGLKVRAAEDNTMAYMFDAAASETAQLTDWVCLGTLYSGGEVKLEVELTVPVTPGNEFSDQVAFFDWEFKAEEFPTEPDDPKPPQTGDETNLPLLIGIAVGCGLVFGILVILLLVKRKKKDEE